VRVREDSGGSVPERICSGRTPVNPSLSRRVSVTRWQVKASDEACGRFHRSATQLPQPEEPSLRTLDDVQRALRTRVGSDDAMKLVTTRVFLRTGVNLKQIRPEQNTNDAVVTKVIGALAAVGHSLS
jgi:hypothetical protein